MKFKGHTVLLFLFIGICLGGISVFLFTERMETVRSVDARYNNLPEDKPASEVLEPDALDTLLQSSGLTLKQLQKLAQTFNLIDTRYYEHVDQDELIDGALQGMLEALNDPYSVYMDAEEYDHFHDAVLDSTFTGIGAEVSIEDGKVTVVAPIKGSPAERAGIRTNDRILKVNDESLEGLSLNEAVLKIRGPKGTKAKLLIERDGVADPMEISIIRDEIDIETVYARQLEEDPIGIIEVRQFSQNTSKRFLEELEALEQNGIQGLVIDVRSNPGGILETAIAMAEPFVPEGKTIVQVEDRDGHVTKTVSSRSDGGKSYPVVVLTNGGSASASEILAAAIRESGQGVLIGETTYGKGLVQSTFDAGVGDGSSIKLTIAKWLTPKGHYINETGILPDIQMVQPEYYQVLPMSKEQVLNVGDLHQDVMYMQIMLDGLQYEIDREDGYFSEMTEQAVIKFQTDHELEANGIVDITTAEAIEQAIIQKMLEEENDVQMQEAIQYLKENIAGVGPATSKK